MEASSEEPTSTRNHGSEGEANVVPPPPTVPLTFPARPVRQQERRQVPNGLIQPPPGGLTQSPEELTRQVGWAALVEAVTQSATTLYPDDPAAVALTVANSLQPYIVSFAPRSQVGTFTSGTDGANRRDATTTPMSRTTESIVLGALSGTKSHEVGKYSHRFPVFPGDRCRDDIDLWESIGSQCMAFKR